MIDPPPSTPPSSSSGTEPAPPGPDGAAGVEGGPARPVGTLSVFLGTLGVSAFGLLCFVFLAPGRFGLGPSPSPNGSAKLPPVDAQRSFAERPPDDAEHRELGSARTVVPRQHGEPTLAQRIFEDAQSSVVHVTTLSYEETIVTNNYSVAGWGTGLIWDRHGHIITSLHVLENAGGATVRLSNGQAFESRLVGMDEASDLAVMRIDAPPELLTPIRVGTSSDLKVGMAAFSVACPYGIAHSLAAGYVSGLNRAIQSTTGRLLAGTIQADIALHPGSSGGALIDDQGRVIGLNAAIHQDSNYLGGVGFAIPIDRLQESVPKIIGTGFRWYPRLGFASFSESRSADLLGRAVTPSTDLGSGGESAAAPGAGDVSIPDYGLVIAEVLPGSPAQEAGLRGMQTVRMPDRPEELRVRDIVISAGGIRVERPWHLETALRETPAGEAVLLEVARVDGVVVIAVTPTP